MQRERNIFFLLENVFNSYETEIVTMYDLQGIDYLKYDNCYNKKLPVQTRYHLRNLIIVCCN